MKRRDPNQGEGDKASARHYDEKARRFVAEGKVAEAARTARTYVEGDPNGAANAERRAKRGPQPTRVSVDELIAKGRTVVERVRPLVERTTKRLRARLGRK